MFNRKLLVYQGGIHRYPSLIPPVESLPKVTELLLGYNAVERPETLGYNAVAGMNSMALVRGDMGVSIAMGCHGGSPIAGWFVMENITLKWIEMDR